MAAVAAVIAVQLEKLGVHAVQRAVHLLAQQGVCLRTG